MQSNGARALVALAGIAVIVVGFIVISGGDDSDDGDSSTTAAVTTTTTEQKQGGKQEQKEQPTEPAAETIEVVGGQPTDGTAELTYSQGDDVNIVVESDTETEFHLHGYDVEEAAAPGKPARFELTADIEGKFELEDHHSGALIAELTVNP